MRRLVLLLAFASVISTGVGFAQVSSQMPNGGGVVVDQSQAVAVDRSGTITNGGQWQQVAEANPNRHLFRLQNPCSATTQGIATGENMLLEFSEAAPTTMFGHFELTPCDSYDGSSTTVQLGTEPIWVFSNTTGHHFTAREW